MSLAGPRLRRESLDDVTVQVESSPPMVGRLVEAKLGGRRGRLGRSGVSGTFSSSICRTRHRWVPNVPAS